jgi:dienelactone hydrolase
MAAIDRERGQLISDWEAILGAGPTAAPAPRAEIVSEDRDAGMRRALIRYAVEEDETAEAYLLEPAGAGPWPGMLVLHSTVPFHMRQPAGLEGPERDHIALHLAGRGYACICPRNFFYGYRGATSHDAVARLRERWPRWTGMAKMLWDAQRALDVLAAWPGVDARRLGVIGHSLGAKQALYVAAFDQRACAAVFSEGGIGIRMCNWNAPWYLGEQVDQPGFTRDHEELLRLTAPRAFLLIAGGGTDSEASRRFVAAALPAYARQDAQDRLAFLNHGQGHRFSDEAQAAADAWLDRWLGVQAFRRSGVRDGSPNEHLDA